MTPSCKIKAFTLIEFLIALVIIGFIVAILVGVFSSPLKQASLDSAVSQAVDGLRTVSDAVGLMHIRTSCDAASGDCTTRINNGELISSGIITAWPTIRASIFTDGVAGISAGGVADAAFWGADRGFVFLMLKNSNGKGVTEEFCKAFNDRMGHGSVIIEQVDPQVVDSAKSAQCVRDAGSFLMDEAGAFAVIWPALPYTP